MNLISINPEQSLKINLAFVPWFHLIERMVGDIQLWALHFYFLLKVMFDLCSGKILSCLHLMNWFGTTELYKPKSVAWNIPFTFIDSFLLTVLAVNLTKAHKHTSLICFYFNTPLPCLRHLRSVFISSLNYKKLMPLISAYNIFLIVLFSDLIMLLKLSTSLSPHLLFHLNWKWRRLCFFKVID